jgi:hypothetical protein
MPEITGAVPFGIEGIAKAGFCIVFMFKYIEDYSGSVPCKNTEIDAIIARVCSLR